MKKTIGFIKQLDIIFMLLLSVVATFAFQKLNAQLIVLLFAAQFVLLIKVKKWSFSPTEYFWGLMALSILSFTGLLYTDNVSRGFDMIGRQISFLLFPVFYSIYRVKNLRILIKIYCLSIFLLILLFEVNTIYRFFYESDTFPLTLDLFFSYRYTGAELTSLLGIHNAYFGMFVTFANVLILDHLSKVKNTFMFVFLLTIICFQSLFLLQMVAKTAIILNAVLLFGSIIYILIKQRKLRLLLFSGTLIALIAFFSFSYLKLPIERIAERYEELSLGEDTDRETRVKLWNAARPIITDNLIIGVGTGDVEDKLHEEYKKNEIISKSNVHNQYLDYLMRYGIIGLLLFLAILCYALLYAIRTGNYIYFCFTLIIIGSCFTENIFSRQWGITFYACFNYLLYLNAKKV